MKLVPPDPSTAPDRGLFNESEMKRMKVLSFTFVLVIIVFGVLLKRSWDDADAAREAAAANEETPRTVTVVPEVDVAALSASVEDGTPEGRVLIEPKALALAFRDSMLVNEQLFEPMQGSQLDAAGVDAIAGDPDAARGRLFRAYGRVDQVRRTPAAGELAEHSRGRMQLEDGAWIYFAILNEPEVTLLPGDFIRVDGLFTKMHSREGPDGWIEAPLIAGPRALTAQPLLDPVLELDPKSFAGVRDDSLNGITGQPYEAYWELVGYVQQLEADGVDWDSAPLLDAEAMHELAKDGTALRAKPVRFPVTQVMEIWSQAQKENPLRITHLSEGWLGSEKWIGPANGVIRFVSPHPFEGITNKENVLARGFFLKHLAYEPRDGGVAIVPFFVLASAETWDAPTNSAWQLILTVFGALIVGLCATIYVLAKRDRERSAELQRELRERRRARQGASATT